MWCKNTISLFLPKLTLSPNWCPLCKKRNESQSHLFMQCTYAQNFWTMILNIFGWHLTFPREVKDLLDIALTYHPFENTKGLLWKNSLWLSFGVCGKRRIKKYLQKRHRLIQNFSLMLLTQLYLGINCLIFLLL